MSAAVEVEELISIELRASQDTCAIRLPRREIMGQQPTGTQMTRETTPLKFVTADEIFNRMKEVYGSIARRAFEIFESHGQVFSRDLADWFQAESEVLHPVHLGIAESEGALTVRAEVPGFNANEIEINLEPRRLTITGKRETREERKTGKTVYSERCSNQIFRSIDLPAEVETAKVRTTFSNGVLEMELQKAAPARKFRAEAKSA